MPGSPTFSSSRSILSPTAIFVALIFTLLFAGGVAVKRFHELATAADEVRESHVVLRSVDRLLMLLASVESAGRGFVLSGQEEFREIADRTIPRVREETGRLAELVAGDSAQIERVETLVRLVAWRLAEVERSVHLVATDRVVDAQAAVRSVAIENEEAKLVAAADGIRAAEESALAERDVRVREARSTSWSILAVTLTLALGLGALAIANSIDAGRRQRRVELALREHADAEERVRAREREFIMLADSMPQLVWTTDATGRFEYLNRRWYEFTGTAEADRSTQRWTDFLHPDDSEHTMKVWTCCLESGDPYQVEYRFRRAVDGAYRWFISRAVPLRGPDGRITRWFGTSTDIDDERRLSDEREAILESERSARGEAERASRLKDDFVATVSHELRTPLNAVLGWTRILQRDHSPETVEQGLEVIERNARAQVRLVEDLLDVSRASSGKLRLELAAVDLPSVVRAAIETIRPAATAKGVSLEVQLVRRAEPMVADPNRLQQIAWNLISNAIKFTPRGGRVDIRLEEHDEHWRLTVADTGAGIAPEFLPHIFDRFRQADASTTRRHGGLGLGLAIARHLVELHGGTIRATSEGLERGSTFVVELPISDARSDANIAMRSRGADELLRLDGVSALVVDDDADARELVSRLLRDRGADVHTAGSASEALTEYERRQPSVLISDIGMPEQDGIDLMRLVQESDRRGRRPRAPAIAVSALARPEDRARALDGGFDEHLAKPFEPTDLIAAVRRLTRREGGTRP